jgi:hypothetical protein
VLHNQSAWNLVSSAFVMGRDYGNLQAVRLNCLTLIAHYPINIIMVFSKFITKAFQLSFLRLCILSGLSK